ncbi:deoxyribodipyrimidine photo-lyase isoform X3 [Lasioglossum baleicum]|uniref:deoxyribodipyrimidine photo-lyase isoform X3 n=1 Tax=Lasioglossum baleicum TaxID=434251 RepID=UPI003FCD71B8
MDESRPPKRKKSSDLIDEFINNRNNTAESISTFNFNKKRVRLLSKLNDVKDDCKGILYWMFRDIRVQDNWALLFAQRTALKNKLPLHVCFCLMSNFLEASMRHYKFLLQGLQEVEEECKTLNINFHLLHGDPNDSIVKFVKTHKIGAVIADFCPLKLPLSWIDNVQNKLPEDVPFCQVDAHNIVPCWEASQKQEFAARTIRNKINTKLNEFLTEFPPVVNHPYSSNEKFVENNWKMALEDTEVDRTAYKRVYPKSVESFMEEAIVRRELSDNFCFYNKNYDLLEGAHAWSMETLNKHRKDKRKYIYSLHELENSKTHDDLWNACQNQMVTTGKMHGFLRMYWAKKILEWTKTPEDALEWANYLNNKYSIDGCDPNGYVGCAWSICGIHDHGWTERDIFGKIRYMNYEGCKRKFNVKEFVSLWEKKETDMDVSK